MLRIPQVIHHHALGFAGGPGSKEQHQGVSRKQGILSSSQLRRGYPFSPGGQLPKAGERGLGFRKGDDGAQRGQRLLPAGIGFPEVRGQGAEHFQVRTVRPFLGKYRPCPGLGKGVAQLFKTVAGIQGRQDGPGLGQGHLGQDPFRTVRSPEGHRVPFLNSQGHQPAGQSSHLIHESPVGETDAPLMMD